MSVAVGIDLSKTQIVFGLFVSLVRLSPPWVDVTHDPQHDSENSANSKSCAFAIVCYVSTTRVADPLLALLVSIHSFQTQLLSNATSGSVVSLPHHLRRDPSILASSIDLLPNPTGDGSKSGTYLGGNTSFIVPLGVHEMEGNP